MLVVLLLLAVSLHAGEEVKSVSAASTLTPILFTGLWIFRLWPHRLIEAIAGKVDPAFLRELSRKLVSFFDWRRFAPQPRYEDYRNLLEARLGVRFQIAVVHTGDRDKVGLARVQSLLSHGHDGWAVSAAYFHEGKYVALLTEKAIDPGQFWALLGIKYRAKSESDLAKLGKRLNRMLGHHKTWHAGLCHVWGNDAPDSGNLWEFRLGTSRFAFRVPTLSPWESKVSDGMVPISVRLAARLLNLPVAKVRPGRRMRLTGLFPFGGLKHDAVVVESHVLGVGIDMLALDPKREIFCDPEHSFLAVLDESHGRDQVRVDVQQAINFGFTARIASGARLLVHLGREWLKVLEVEVMQLDFVQKQLTKLTSRVNEPVSADDAGKEKNVSTLAAFLSRLSKTELGFDFRQAPTLWKALTNTLLGSVFELSKLRVPLHGHAVGRYVVFDYSILHKGQFGAGIQLLDEGECFISGLQFPEGVDRMEIIATRQPGGSAKEHRKLWAVRRPELIEFFGDEGVSIVINIHDVVSVLETLGGGDQDDCLVIYHSPLMVEFFKKNTAKLAAQYPDVPRPVDPNAEQAQEAGPFVLTPASAYGLAVKLSSVPTIGQVVNIVMVFNYLESIKRWLAQQKVQLRMPELMAWVSGCLDAVIDGANKDGKTVYGLVEAMEDFKNKVSHVPSSLLSRLGGQGWLYDRDQEGTPVRVLKDTPLEQCISRLAEAISETRKACGLSLERRTPLQYVMDCRFTGYEGALKLASTIHNTYREELNKRAHSLMSEFYGALAPNRQFTEGEVHTLREVCQRLAYKDACAKVYGDIRGLSDEKLARLMIAYYAGVHGSFSAKGRQLPDSLLWSDEFQMHTVAGIEMAYALSHPAPPEPQPEQTEPVLSSSTPAAAPEATPDEPSTRERLEDYKARMCLILTGPSSEMGKQLAISNLNVDFQDLGDLRVLGPAPDNQPAAPAEPAQEETMKHLCVFTRGNNTAANSAPDLLGLQSELEVNLSAEIVLDANWDNNMAVKVKQYELLTIELPDWLPFAEYKANQVKWNFFWYVCDGDWSKQPEKLQRALVEMDRETRHVVCHLMYHKGFESGSFLDSLAKQFRAKKPSLLTFRKALTPKQFAAASRWLQRQLRTTENSLYYTMRYRVVAGLPQSAKAS